jgi:hypothetical protein
MKYQLQRNKKANERQFMTLYKINYQSGNLFYIFLLMPELMFSSSRKHWGWGLEINNLVNVSVRPVSTKFNNIHQVHIHYHN